VHQNETELDDTGGQAETVERLAETLGMYRSTLPAPASQWCHDVALPELHMAAATIWWWVASSGAVTLLRKAFLCQHNCRSGNNKSLMEPHDKCVSEGARGGEDLHVT